MMEAKRRMTVDVRRSHIPAERKLVFNLQHHCESDVRIHCIFLILLIVIESMNKLEARILEILSWKIYKAPIPKRVKLHLGSHICSYPCMQRVTIYLIFSKTHTLLCTVLLLSYH